MQALSELISDALRDFQQVSALAKAELQIEKIKIEINPKPHKAPTALPSGYIAVYAFFIDGKAVKVGKAGSKSKARYTSQHYNPDSAPSNLANSILNSPHKVPGTGSVRPQDIGFWIKSNADRVNLLLPASCGNALLSLLEAFLHVRWDPLFEGRAEKA